MSTFDSTPQIRFRACLAALRMGSTSARAACFYAGFDLIMMAETAEELGKRPEIRKELERAKLD